MAGAKKGGSRWGRKAQKGKEKGALPSLPNPPPFFPSSLRPLTLLTPAMQAIKDTGFTAVKTDAVF